MEIKKDKKGLVYVQGAEVKPARNAKELFALFEAGSKTRHTAATSKKLTFQKKKKEKKKKRKKKYFDKNIANGKIKRKQ